MQLVGIVESVWGEMNVVKSENHSGSLSGLRIFSRKVLNKHRSRSWRSSCNHQMMSFLSDADH